MFYACKNIYRRKLSKRPFSTDEEDGDYWLIDTHNICYYIMAFFSDTEASAKFSVH